VQVHTRGSYTTIDGLDLGDALDLPSQSHGTKPGSPVNARRSPVPHSLKEII